MKKSITFNDFSKLILKGSQNFLSYGEFLSKNPNSTKYKRRKMITYFYKSRL